MPHRRQIGFARQHDIAAGRQIIADGREHRRRQRTHVRRVEDDGVER